MNEAPVAQWLWHKPRTHHPVSTQKAPGTPSNPVTVTDTNQTYSVPGSPRPQVQNEGPLAVRLEGYGVHGCVFLAPARLASANCARERSGVRVSKKERKLESQISFPRPQDASTEGLWTARLHPTL